MRREDLTSLVKWNVYIIVVNIIVLFLFSFVSGQGAVGIVSLRPLPTLLLIESAIAFIIGSSLEMSSSIFFSKVREYVLARAKERWSKEEYEKGRQRASPYVVLGFFLFSEAFISSFVIG